MLIYTYLYLKNTMSSQENIGQIAVVEEPAKPKKISYKKLYQAELKRRKNAENSLEEKNNELAKLKLEMEKLSKCSLVKL